MGADWDEGGLTAAPFTKDPPAVSEGGGAVRPRRLFATLDPCPKTIDVSPTYSWTASKMRVSRVCSAFPGRRTSTSPTPCPGRRHSLRVGPPRAGGVVHGRNVRASDRSCRRLLGHPWSGRDQPAAGDGRRQHQQHPGRGVLRPGWAEPYLQGVPPERRSGVHVHSGDQMGRHRPHPGGGARNGP